MNIDREIEEAEERFEQSRKKAAIACTSAIEMLEASLARSGEEKVERLRPSFISRLWNKMLRR